MNNLPEVDLRARFDLQLSAASGLVLRDPLAWVIADDRPALHAYRLADGEPLHTRRLEAAQDDVPLPKSQKPDLEALVALPDGRLLALGSGSRSNRDRGWLIDDAGTQGIDFSELYTRLRAMHPALNIEGAVVQGSQLLLAHRGMVRGSSSGIARVDLDAVLHAPNHRVPAQALIDFTPIELGVLEGVALGFTDLALDAQGGLHFLASAEDTRDPYLDGACHGTVIGRLDAALAPTLLAQLRPVLKAEGLAYWRSSAAKTHWLIVTDADDPARASTLYECCLPR